MPTVQVPAQFGGDDDFVTGAEAAAEIEEQEQPKPLEQISEPTRFVTHMQAHHKRQRLSADPVTAEVDISALVDLELVTLWRELRTALKGAEVGLQKQGGRRGVAYRRAMEHRIQACKRKFDRVCEEMNARNFGHGLDPFNIEKWPEVWASN